jgi:hypothetical protein
MTFPVIKGPGSSTIVSKVQLEAMHKDRDRVINEGSRTRISVLPVRMKLIPDND